MRLRFWCALLIFFQLCGPAWADSETRVTQSFVNTDLIYVIKFLAKEMGRNIYIAPPVKGTVTLDLANVPAIEALKLALEQQKCDYEFRVLDGPSVHVVIVAPRDMLEEISAESLGCRMRGPANQSPRLEFVLEEELADTTLDQLKSQFSEVEFTPHPTMTGFYAKGPRKTLLEIRNELRRLGLL